MVLRGQVVDSTTRKGLAYAMVQITSAKGEPLGGGMCDSTGTFAIPKLPRAAVKMYINTMGYRTLAREVDLASAEEQLVDLGQVEASIDQVAIEQVEIQGELPQVVLKPDRKEIHIPKTDVKAGTPLSDVLARLPDFSQGADGKLSLRGGTFTVMVNGHPSGTTVKQLDMLDLKNIEAIEVITTPSVQYRTGSMGGIVNIKMKRFQVGYNAVLQAFGGIDNHYSASLSSNIALEKINFFITLYGSYYGVKEGYDARVTNAEGQKLRHTHMNGRTNDWEINPTVGFDWAIGNSDALSFFWNSDFSRMKPRKQVTLSSWDTEGKETSSESQFDRDMKPWNHSLNLTYSHQFSQQTGLTVNATGMLQQMNSISTHSGGELGNSQWRQYMHPGLAMYMGMLSIDFHTPLASRLFLQTGLAMDYSHSSDREQYEQRATADATWAPIANQRFGYSTQAGFYGYYAQLQWAILDQLSMQVGGRMEFQHQDVEALSGYEQYEPIRRRNFYGVGGLGFSYYPLEWLSLSLNYGGNIQRPSAFDLIPTYSLADFLGEYYHGNPDLRSAFDHMVSLESQQQLGSATLSESASWTYTLHPIESSVMRDSEGRWLKSPKNLDWSQKLYLSFNVDWRAAQWCALWGGVNGNGYSVQNEQKEWLVHDAWNLGASAGFQFYFGKQWELASWASYSSPHNQAYRHFDQHAVNLHAQLLYKPIKNLTLSLRARNLLATPYEYTTYDKGEATQWTFDWIPRTVYLSVLWRIGGDFRSRSGQDLRTKFNPVKVK